MGDQQKKTWCSIVIYFMICDALLAQKLNPPAINSMTKIWLAMDFYCFRETA